MLAALAFMLVANFAWAGGSLFALTDEVRGAFIVELRESFPSVELTEWFSEGVDNPTHLKADLSDRAFDEAVGIVHRELRATVSKDSPQIHLGLLALQYASAGVAREIETVLRTRGPVGTFKTGKLLIRFTTVRRESDVLVAYSETPLRPEIEALFESIRRSSS